MATVDRVEDLKVYSKSMELGRSVWTICGRFDYWQSRTIGYQFIRSTDSISANISEGFGRFHFKDNARFCYMARGSLFESTTWLAKAHERDIISTEQYDALMKDFVELRMMLNGYIRSLLERSS